VGAFENVSATMFPLVPNMGGMMFPSPSAAQMQQAYVMALQRASLLQSMMPRQSVPAVNFPGLYGPPTVPGLPPFQPTQSPELGGGLPLVLPPVSNEMPKVVKSQSCRRTIVSRDGLETPRPHRPTIPMNAEVAGLPDEPLLSIREYRAARSCDRLLEGDNQLQMCLYTDRVHGSSSTSIVPKMQSGNPNQIVEAFPACQRSDVGGDQVVWGPFWTYEEVMEAQRQTNTREFDNWPENVSPAKGKWAAWLPKGWGEGYYKDFDRVRGRRQGVWVSPGGSVYSTKEEVLRAAYGMGKPKPQAVQWGKAPDEIDFDLDAPRWPRGNWLPNDWFLCFRLTPTGVGKAFVTPDQKLYTVKRYVVIDYLNGGSTWPLTSLIKERTFARRKLLGREPEFKKIRLHRRPRDYDSEEEEDRNRWNSKSVNDGDLELEPKCEAARSPNDSGNDLWSHSRRRSVVSRRSEDPEAEDQPNKRIKVEPPIVPMQLAKHLYEGSGGTEQDQLHGRHLQEDDSTRSPSEDPSSCAQHDNSTLGSSELAPAPRSPNAAELPEAACSARQSAAERSPNHGHAEAPASEISSPLADRRDTPTTLATDSASQSADNLVKIEASDVATSAATECTFRTLGLTCRT